MTSSPPSPAKKTTKVWGHSDDVVCFDGAVYGECYPDSSDKAYVTFSDGTELRIVYGDNGCWRIVVVEKGDLFDHLEVCDYDENDEASKGYSDIAHFKEGLEWAECRGKRVK